MFEPKEKAWSSLSKIGLSEPKLFPYLVKFLPQARSASILGHSGQSFATHVSDIGGQDCSTDPGFNLNEAFWNETH